VGPGDIARVSNSSASAANDIAPIRTDTSFAIASASAPTKRAHDCNASAGANTNTNAAQNMRAVAPSADARACCSFIRRR
jgi:hypothetical protein